MAIEIITKSDLDIFKIELLKDLTDLLRNRKPVEERKYMKSNDVRKMLGLSAGTLQTLRINGSLPYTKLNGTLYYEYADILTALDKNKLNIKK